MNVFTHQSVIQIMSCLFFYLFIYKFLNQMYGVYQYKFKFKFIQKRIELKRRNNIVINRQEMLSINQLSLSAHDFQNSKGYSNTYNNNTNSLKKANNNNMSIFDNQPNSRQLFKKCKQIIQQQMMQIARLSQENERLSGEISSMREQSQEQKRKMHQVMRENAQVREKNELLHKEMSKLRRNIQDMSRELTGKQNVIKLKENKIELIEDVLGKANLQKSALEEKLDILEQTVGLLQRQLGKSQEIVWQKESQMRLEIQELRRVKMMLQRNGKVEGVDEELGNGMGGVRNKFACRPYFTVKDEESPFQKVDIINQLKSLQKTQYSSAQLRRDNHPNNRSSTITPFSIIEERQSSSPVSRIRKNFSKPKNKDDTTPQTNNTRKSSDNSRSKQRLTLTGKLSSKKDSSSFMVNSHQLSNPEMSQELSNIKKEILQQYSKMQIKKGLISHDRINQTLQQIENKLQKMVKISAMDESQSQLQ